MSSRHWGSPRETSSSTIMAQSTWPLPVCVSTSSGHTMPLGDSPARQQGTAWCGKYRNWLSWAVSKAGVSKSRYYGISIPIKYSNFSRFYKKKWVHFIKNSDVISFVIDQSLPGVFYLQKKWWISWKCALFIKKLPFFFKKTQFCILIKNSNLKYELYKKLHFWNF